MKIKERRRFQRISIGQPIVARFGSAKVLILDLSLPGAAIESKTQLKTGEEANLTFRWDDEDISLGARIIRSRLAGFDVDPSAVDVASRNAKLLGVSARARFDCADLWSDATIGALSSYEPHLIICNPPYIPEPPGGRLELEAGSGADGTAHLMRTIELADKVQPRAMALSWCSLCNPAGIVREAESIGYSLNSLFIVVIADGEYSGSVHDHLRSLPCAYISEAPDTIEAVAPDGSARFAYLLMAGDFSRKPQRSEKNRESANAVGRMCEEFAEHGIGALQNPVASVPVRTWLLDRWDEVRLRAFLHGARDDNMSA